MCTTANEHAMLSTRGSLIDVILTRGALEAQHLGVRLSALRANQNTRVTEEHDAQMR